MGKLKRVEIFESNAIRLNWNACDETMVSQTVITQFGLGIAGRHQAAEPLSQRVDHAAAAAALRQRVSLGGTGQASVSAALPTRPPRPHY